MLFRSLWIQDGDVEIRDAANLWGKDNWETLEGLREELGDKRIRVASIGPAGERLIPFACVQNDLEHFNGRAGMGAVMGSKNLKAVAVRGKQKLEMADPDSLKEIRHWHNERQRGAEQSGNFRSCQGLKPGWNPADP